MSMRRLYLCLFCVVTLVVALVYWWYTDWWAYVDLGTDRGRIPKFSLPWGWQLAESSIVGAVVGAVLVGIVYVVVQQACDDDP